MATPPPPGQNPYAQPYAQPHVQPHVQSYPQPVPQHPQQPVGQHPQHPGPYPYAQQQYPQPQAPHPGAWPAPGPMGGPLSCRICGAQPAVHATVRGHQGLIIIMRFLKSEGAFCRSCGMATYREMSANTLWQGWWGYLSLVITPFTLLSNFFTRFRFTKLSPPSGGWRPPLDPGKPIPLRPAGLLFLLPVALVVLAVTALIGLGVVGAATEQEPIAVGSCVRNDGTWTEQDLEVVDCGSPDAQFKVTNVLDEVGEKCDGPIGDEKYSADKTSLLCLRSLD